MRTGSMLLWVTKHFPILTTQSSLVRPPALTCMPSTIEFSFTLLSTDTHSSFSSCINNLPPTTVFLRTYSCPVDAICFGHHHTKFWVSRWFCYGQLKRYGGLFFVPPLEILLHFHHIVPSPHPSVVPKKMSLCVFNVCWKKIGRFFFRGGWERKRMGQRKVGEHCIGIELNPWILFLIFSAPCISLFF